MSTTLSESQILNYFLQKFHCSQVVLSQWAEELGYDPEELARVGSALGGGMGRGETCGAVTGAIIALGLRYGHGEPGDIEANALVTAKAAEFQRRFMEANGSTQCRELLDCDFTQESERKRAFDEGLIASHCPGFVNCALSILDDLM